MRTVFTWAARFEGLTLLLLLLVAVPLKHLYGHPEAVRLLGPLHGIAFLAYQYSLFRLYQDGELPTGWPLRASLASFIPAGTWWVLKRLKRAQNSSWSWEWPACTAAWPPG